ncbi:MAG: hypothetical protein L3J98_00880 [Gammaproteobacteria bacterium]|nr:hypothetical protein [Gammaproteobacteria bacterium]MCF6258709.1 hypothetical protein [Gammaproteobacteria bacterium]
MDSSRIFCALFITLISASTLQAGEVIIPNTFSAGNTAVAADVNDNFVPGDTIFISINIRL